MRVFLGWKYRQNMLFKDTLTIIKFHSNPVILLNRSKFHSKKVNTRIFEYVGEMAVEIFESKIQKV